MPLWLVYHPPGTFEDDASKQAFVKDITANYTRIGLPAFYVVVNFVKTDPANLFVGGVRKENFVRVVISHIAVNQPNKDEAYAGVRQRIHDILKPHIFDKGYDSEFHIEETERRMWEINGIVPPPFRSEQEKVWSETNTPAPWLN